MEYDFFIHTTSTGLKWYYVDIKTEKFYVLNRLSDAKCTIVSIENYRLAIASLYFQIMAEYQNADIILMKKEILGLSSVFIPLNMEKY